MSRSRRRAPVMGMTMAESNKTFKASEHRRERRFVRVALTATSDCPPTTPKMFGGCRNSPKDGMQRFDPALHGGRWMRK